MKLVCYKYGHRYLLDEFNRGAIVEVEMNDGRTIQLCVDEDGEVNLRGWGNIPGKVGNWSRMNFTAQLLSEVPTHCDICYNHLEECKCR